MYPGKDPEETAEIMAEFFNNISEQYLPFDKENIPSTKQRSLPFLNEANIVEKIKKSKKTRSMVPGDLPPILYDLYPDILAAPIADIFNMITRTKEWPPQWKLEHVTVIPKIPNPQYPSECRNISCTNYLSKLYESFVLSWSREEVRPSLNQFGGETGASASHLLIEVMDDITSALEDNRAGMILSAIDFSKAFNRLNIRTALTRSQREDLRPRFYSYWDRF